MNRHRFSVVIPAYNEAAYLPRLLDSITAARARYRGGADAVEVIVADNASTDATAALAARRGCRVVRVEKRCIGAARNGGARVATGDVLCFIDADNRIHPDTFNVIERRMARGRLVGGATGWTLERRSPGLLCTALVMRLAIGLLRINAGVVFCRADVFHDLGGYDEGRRYAEDVVFFRAMRAAGRRRGLGTVLSTEAPAVISTRKFDSHGDWHMLLLWLWILRNRSLGKTVDDYWYNESTRF
jgi:glycosyltransferase involved in cell wall biosynthesis